jgi:hypothetical protein
MVGLPPNAPGSNVVNWREGRGKGASDLSYFTGIAPCVNLPRYGYQSQVSNDGT